MSKLTNKQRMFIEEYLTDFNATQAAKRAGYKGNLNTLSSIGCENLTKPSIKKRISDRLNESAMSAEEALQRLAGFARGDRDKLSIRALELILKTHGSFTESVDITSKGKSILVTGGINLNDDI